MVSFPKMHLIDFKKRENAAKLKEKQSNSSSQKDIDGSEE